MRHRSALAVLGSLAVLSPDLSAQQTPTPPYWRVTEWESPPAEMATFRARFTELARMAQAAKAPASSGFLVYSTENRTIVARPADPKDLLAPVNAVIREAQPDAFRQWQAKGTGGSVIVRSEVWVEVPAHSYRPAGEITGTGISVAEVRVAAGKGAVHDSARRDFVTLRQKVGYPYPVYAYRVVFGEARMVYVTVFDSREKFYGTNAFAALVEKANAGAEWQALAPRLLSAMDADWSSKVWNYNATMSYMPAQ